jgi:hypothetical protein
MDQGVAVHRDGLARIEREIGRVAAGVWILRYAQMTVVRMYSC